jgi:uncharacterized BrkB/YihY/UPF0761 family membrane protein
LGKAYGEAKAGNYAAALAFQGFMSMFPLLLGILAIVGLVIRDPHRLAQVRNLIVNAFPSDSQAQSVAPFRRCSSIRARSA